MNEENKRKHLEFIQTIVSRNNTNSFYIKGWLVTIVSAILALSISNGYPDLVYICFFSIIVFWILDGYYLRQERLFRCLYDKVRKLEFEEIDFNLSTAEFKNEDYTLLRKTLFSASIIFFYSSIFVLIYSIILILRCNEKTCIF